jgi:NAD(P)-dependent dehydrogenase (short-subunit alcohol dehydrogenase family)
VAVTIDHSGKVVLVTGAGAGIGREIARWFARAGASVVVNDIRAGVADDVVREIEDAGGTAAAIAADCRDDAQVEALVAGTVARFGRLDVAVNNVGMLPSGRSLGAFVDMDSAYWHDLLDQNLVVSARCARAEAKVLVGQGAGGVILFVSSGETTRPSPHNAAYAAAKAAINHLTTTLAVELGPSGVRVNAMAPGTTLTETVRSAFSDEHVARIVESTPLRRGVEHDELGRLAVFLASDLARCITGQVILADAGAFLSRTRPANPVPNEGSEST